MKRWRKLARIFVTTLLVVVLLGAGGAAYWQSRTHPASDLALQALQSDALVKVAEQNGIITFEPVGTQAATGFIFYPGAGVDYRAYAPVLRSIAERGYFVALVDMPLNLAFFRADAATDVMESYNEIDVWAVGGHSLGGVVAAMYAANHTDRVDGVIFFASYPGDDGLKNTAIRVVSIYGTNDGLATRDQIEESRQLLPADAEFIPIEGGNHSQFGSYGFQTGDGVAEIPAEEQWAQVASVTAQFLGSLAR